MRSRAFHPRLSFRATRRSEDYPAAPGEGSATSTSITTWSSLAL